MTDADFLAAFESGRVAPADFHHREHVRLTWLYLGRDGLDQGRARMVGAIRAFAAAAGKPNLYLEDLTQAWIERVWSALQADRRDAARAPAAFDHFAARHPDLLNKDLVKRKIRPEPADNAGSPRALAG